MLRSLTVAALSATLAAGAAIGCGLAAWAADDPTPATGPATESRFPPLVVPPGFRATLFACDPLIEYPSAIALGPRPGSVFVAVDYMTGLGDQIVRRDEVRLVEDTDRDGYADRAAVWAEGFNSIEGLTWHDGTIYAMHAPLLTALRDTDGDGTADQRWDLLTGLGLPPEENPHRLHCANGVVAGHDGWLYLALGDHGCDVARPEGDRLVLEGGGILRCRPDGRDLHVFATGLRNIYDVALDEGLNVFVRDNENDGGDYKVRVCHSFFGADHGYPYLYSERPDEALAPLADLGLGSSAGGVCYLERQFPPEYRGNLFFCEWGRAVVRYRPQPQGSGFAQLAEEDFAAGAPDDPYGFKPTDVIVDREGSLVVADWADGQQPQRGRGRVYRISYVAGAPGPGANVSAPSATAVTDDESLDKWVAQLDAEAYYDRLAAQVALEDRPHDAAAALSAALAEQRLGRLGRVHALWALARAGGASAHDDLFRVAETDRDPSVQAQAVRALADAFDPVLAEHRLDAGPGDARIAERIAALGRECEPCVALEVVVALGRLRWPGLPEWLRAHVTQFDPPLAHAAVQALRRTGNWPAVLALLDGPQTDPLRRLALRAVAGQFDATVVDGLIARLRTASDPARRSEYADALAGVYCKPGPWVYWGYRPAPRPAGTEAWERTQAVGDALAGALADPDRSVRLAALRRIEREAVPVGPESLGRWLRDEREPEAAAALIEALGRQRPQDARGWLRAAVRDATHDQANRRRALALWDDALDLADQEQLLALADGVEDGPILAELLRRVGRRPGLAGGPLALRHLDSAHAEVRAAALAALAGLHVVEAADAVCRLLADDDPQVRAAAADAAGRLAARQASDTLLGLTGDTEADVRRASLAALGRLGEPRALPLALAALGDRAVQREALECLGQLGGPDQAAALVDLAQRDTAAATLADVIGTLAAWGQRPDLPEAQRRRLAQSIADVQGGSGVLLHWHVLPPAPAEAPARTAEELVAALASSRQPDALPPPWRTELAAGVEARLRLAAPQPGAAWLAAVYVAVPESTQVEFLAGSSGTFRAWVNGREVCRRDEPRTFQPDSDRFSATLDEGANRLLVQVSSPDDAAELQVRFRRRSAVADRERLAQAALAGEGDVERGRRVFLDAARSQCAKCHRLGDQGERIGPELTGVGSRFSRVHLVESILEPSRAVLPGYATTVVSLSDGRVVTGVKLAESETTLTLADARGEKHELAKDQIEEQSASPLSTMPEGLEKQLTPDEFLDLVAFLASQQEPAGR